MLNHYSRSYGEMHNIFWSILVFVIFACLFIIALWCSSSLSITIGGLFITGIMLQIGQLNSIIAGLGSPCLSGIILICTRAIFGSILESKHFYSVCFTNFIHVSTCLLLWWWYDDGNACSVLRLLQKVFNLPEMKLPPESDIFFFSTLYPVKMI